MLHPSIAYLREVYEYDPQQHLFTIKVSSDHYEDLFNRLDPTPFRRRDISPDFKAFLEDCSDEIPTRYPVRLKLVLTAERQDPLLEREICDGLHNYFAYILNVNGSKIRQKRLRALKYLLFSLSSIVSAIILRGVLPASLPAGVLLEGLTIAGWVFLWETISVNFIQMDDLQHDQRKYRRLIRAEISFAYS